MDVDDAGTEEDDDVLQLFYRTQIKGVEKFRKAQDTVLDYHRALWPGIQIRLMSSKHAKVPQDGKQSFWLRQNTLPTSMIFALIAYGINYKFRNVADRTLVCAGLTAIVSKLASTLGGFELLHDRFGVESNERVTLQVDSSGRVEVSALWTQAFFQRFARQWWRKDAQNSAKTWVNGQDPGAQVLLSEFLTFCLDPQHSDLKSLGGVLLNVDSFGCVCGEQYRCHEKRNFGEINWCFEKAEEG
eukprot:s253_g25.t1